MHWEVKLKALNALSECSLKMRGPGDWYVSQNVEIKDKHVLKGDYGNGLDPESAVEDHWKRLTEDLQPHEYLVAREYWDGSVCKRMAVRWNGFMWDHVIETKAPESVAA